MRNKLFNSFSLLLAITLLKVNFASAQMVGPNAYISATSLQLGLDGQGGFEGCSTTISPPLVGMFPRSTNPLFGFVANPQVNLWATFDGDFFTPGTPENGWGIDITGGPATGNNCTGEFNIPGTMTDWTQILNCYSADWEGDLTVGTNLHFKINYFLQETDLFYTTTVSITNNTSATIPEMFYYRNLDPDNNVSISFDYTTQNTIVSQPGTGCNLAHVSATSLVPASQPQSYLGLAAVGANYRVCFGGFSNRDGSDLWNGGVTTSGTFTQTVGATNFADEGISLSYKIQNLAPGATEVIKFVVILDDASATQAINNLLYLSYPGSTIGTPAVCSPYIDSIQTCGGAVPISVAGPTISDYTWNWLPTTGLSSSTGAVVIANPSTTTTYTVTGTPISSCVAPISFTFVVEVTPGGGAPPVITSVPPICISNPPFNLVVDSSGGVWSGTGITNTSTGTFNPATAGLGTFMITYYIPGMCYVSDTIMVTVNNGSDPTITQPPTICLGSGPITLTAATAGGVWSGTGITSSSAGTFDPTIAGAGPEVITYTISGICSAVDTVTINIVTTFSATITPPATVCQGTPAFNLTAASAGGTWTGTGITSSSAGTFDPGLSGGGTFTITYSIGGACGDTASQNITINSVPTPSFISSDNDGCVGDCFNFFESVSTTCANVVYYFGDGDSALVTAPNHCYQTAGTFSVTLQCISSNGCVGTITIPSMITIYPIPVANFTMSPVSPVLPTTTVGFNDISTGGGISVWNFDDPGSGSANTSTLSSPTHTFNDEGDFCVTLIASNLGGCTDTVKYCIIVIGEGTIFIPNIFTPNGDGTNDLWMVTTKNMKEVYYDIYDRWGLKIAEYNGLTGGWDGETKNGGAAPDGTYYYVLHATAINGKTVDQTGFLQLLRQRK